MQKTGRKRTWGLLTFSLGVHSVDPIFNTNPIGLNVQLADHAFYYIVQSLVFG